MEIDIAQLYQEELIQLNHVVDIFEIPTDVFRDFGLSRLQSILQRDAEKVVRLNIESGKDIPAALILLNNGDADSQFNQLCQAAPHIPKSALSSLCLAYGVFLVMTRNGEDMSGLKASGGCEMESLKTLMSITMIRGLTMGLAGLNSGVLQTVKANAERKKKQAHATSKRHEENRAMKREVFNWLDANPPQKGELDKTADTIKELNLVPMAWRTIREWIGEWRKLRSNRTA